ncbi:hypothetical protein NX059_012439 [Plenodomus lindquistii]|nr:hypothetical protein NX059_012439 [Plenodomus lindquistii]
MKVNAHTSYVGVSDDKNNAKVGLHKSDVRVSDDKKEAIAAGEQGYEDGEEEEEKTKMKPTAMPVSKLSPIRPSRPLPETEQIRG